MFEAHPVVFAIAPDGQFEPFAERVDHRYAHAVEATRNLVGIVVRGVLELAACMQLGHDDLGGRDAFFLVHVNRNAAAVILDRDRAIGVERSEEHTSELQSLMRISYAVFCVKKKTEQK